MNLSTTQLNNLKKVFKKHQAEFAYLFGSQVSGQTHKESDFDFAVMFPDKIDYDSRYESRLKMTGEIGHVIGRDDVDLVVLNDTRKILLSFDIISKGKSIFEKESGSRVDFELKAMNDYYDNKDFFNAYTKAHLARCAAGN